MKFLVLMALVVLKVKPQRLSIARRSSRPRRRPIYLEGEQYAAAVEALR